MKTETNAKGTGRIRVGAVLILAAALVAGCAGPGDRPAGNQAAGALVGAGAGALVGSKFGKGGGRAAMTIAGAALGGAAGAGVGRRLDEAEAREEGEAAAAAMRAALGRAAIGVPVAWEARSSRAVGQVVATYELPTLPGAVACRGYAAVTVRPGRKPEEGRGEACAWPDGGVSAFR